MSDHLQRILRSYIDYYQHWRTHLALGKDPPASRAVEPVVWLIIHLL